LKSLPGDTLKLQRFSC